MSLSINILSRNFSKLSQIIVQILPEKRLLCVFIPSDGLRGNVTIHLRLRGKLAVDYLFVLIVLSGEALRANIDFKGEG